MKPNIVLITVDQMRRDCMGIAGHPIVETPHLDSFRHKGYQFTRAYSAVPTCIAARAALLTGMSQKNHGRVGYEDGVAWRYAHTLPGEMTRAGYQTQCVGKMHVYPSRSCVGFENVLLHDGYLHDQRHTDRPFKEAFQQVDDYLYWLKDQKGMTADIMDAGLACNDWTARPWPYDEQYHPTNWVTVGCIDFLRRRDPTRPFFLHASFVRPHSPLDPPKYYYDLYDRQDISLPPVGDWADKADDTQYGLKTDCMWGEIPQKALKRARAAYYGLITHVDHQIGRMMQAFFEQRIVQDTVFIFTSDHGDLLGDHHLFRKSFPYEGSAGIPLLIYDPAELLGGKVNQQIDTLVELRDIMPTILDIAGAGIPDTVEGHSLLKAIKDPKLALREYIHGEHVVRERSHQFIVTRQDKYIWYTQSGAEQYFNLAQDPQEMHNLIHSPAHQKRIEQLRRTLIAELTGREEGYTDGTRLVAGQTPVPTLSILRE